MKVWQIIKRSLITSTNSIASIRSSYCYGYTEISMQKIILDQKVNTILKEFPYPDVTVRTLLTHRRECGIMPISQKKEFGTDTKS
jgi:hypothetical protein